MRRLLAVAVVLLLSRAALAQQFEVASIKLAAPDAPGMFINSTPGGRLKVTNMTLKELIAHAWRVQSFQISGGPAWLDSVRYDISAKSEINPKPGEAPVMLQALLTERFQLTMRRETKELPVYALVLAKKDGKLGPRLTESKEGGCTERDLSKALGPPEPGNPRCGSLMVSFATLRGTSIPVAQIIPTLSRMLGRSVVDRTGLTAKFDISMEWPPDDSQMMQLPPGVPLPPSDGTRPSIFTAIQEQLGLKLESQKGPVEILVIERAEKPSEN
jgi:uncharacterized protein (TIGR03435 family)